MTNTLKTTYRSKLDPTVSIELVYDADLQAAEFTAIGIDPEGALICAAVDAEGADSTLDGNEWLSELS